MINRISGPKIYDDFHIDIPEAKTYVLDNGMHVYEIYADSHPISKIEYCSRAGRIHELKPAVARTSFRVSKEATQNYNSDQLADTLDFYGADIFNAMSLDGYKLSLSTLNQHFEKVFRIWEDVLISPKFDAKDLKRITSLSAQKLQDELVKNKVIAYREFTKNIFGEEHMYGYNTMPDEIKKVTVDEVKHFYSSNVGSDNGALFLSGKFSDKDRDLIFSSLGNWKKETIEPELKTISKPTLKSEMLLDFGQDKQFSIKMGKRLFKRNHPDFAGFFVLNTVLGGYFGSRLMSKIREEKGYCYNIYSNIDAMVHDGFWYISAEVGNENVNATVDEILKILSALRTELIPESELKMVKNYLQGHLLSLFDGPFSSSRVLQSAWKYNLSIEEMNHFIEKVRNINAEELLALANKYLTEEGLFTLKVGKIKK